VVSHQARRWPSESSELSRQQRLQEMTKLDQHFFGDGGFQGRRREKEEVKK